MRKDTEMRETERKTNRKRQRKGKQRTEMQREIDTGKRQEMRWGKETEREKKPPTHREA